MVKIYCTMFVSTCTVSFTLYSFATFSVDFFIFRFVFYWFLPLELVLIKVLIGLNGSYTYKCDYELQHVTIRCCSPGNNTMF